MSKKEYLAACHAMQSGVAQEMVTHPAATHPKHLRVGVNTVLVDHGALVGLLVKKGLITEQEYIDAITAGMRLEVERYEAALTADLGVKVTLA